MAKFFVPLVATAEAATLAVTWQDCGDDATHAKISDLQPPTIETGSTTTIMGTGVLDETVTGATFSQVIKADGVKIASCSGDASQDVTCKLPLGVGSLTLKAQTFPMAAGTVSIPVETKISSLIPASLAKTQSHVTGTSDTGDNLFCIDVNTAKQEELEVTATGGTLALTWSDCGGAHGTTTSVEPSTLSLGETTEIVGKGSTDKAITAGTYDMHMTAGGGLINKHFTGNNCEAKDFDLPLGLGKLSWAGIECPLAVGDTELHFTTQLAAALPASLAKSDIEMKALDQDGETALCVNIHMQKQDLEVKDRPDCSAAACEANCECSYTACSDQVDACLAVSACAASQDCAFACACGDGKCLLACAAKSPSLKALTLAKCITSNCDAASVQV